MIFLINIFFTHMNNFNFAKICKQRCVCYCQLLRDQCDGIDIREVRDLIINEGQII